MKLLGNKWRWGGISLKKTKDSQRPKSHNLMKRAETGRKKIILTMTVMENFLQDKENKRESKVEECIWQS